MTGRRLSSVGMISVLALAAAVGVGSAQSGPGASTPTNGVAATAANTYPTTVSVAASGTVATISVVLHGVTTNGGTRSSIAFAGLVLVAPSGKSMEIYGEGAGDDSDNGGLSNVTITFQDGNGAVTPPNTTLSASAAENWKPSSIGSGSHPEPHSYIAHMPNFSGTPQFFAAPHAGATFANTFVGETAAGTWSLYLEDFGGDPVSFTSWDLVLTESAAAGTTTTVSSNLNPSFTASPNNAVTLTATVSSGGAGQPTGTVGFTDNGAGIGCPSQPLTGAGANSSTATCVHTFASEGNRPVVATYSGAGSFAPSTSTTFYQISRNHSTVAGNQFCNTGALLAPGIPSTQFIYPSYIQVSGLTNTVADVSVTLNGLQGLDGVLSGQFLLVSPGNAHNLDFLSHVGDTNNQGSVNVTISDNPPHPSPPFGNNGASLASTTYGSTDAHNVTDTFTPQPPLPNTQVPGSFNLAQPSPNPMTLTQAFSGDAGNGEWALFMYSNGGLNTNLQLASGWCLNFTLNTGNPSFTTIASNHNPARSAVPVTFTATVKDGSNNPITSGTVTFTENNSPPAGTVGGNNVVAVNGAGQATFITASLSEGDHTILATFTSGSFNSSNHSVVQRIDNNSTITGSSPTLNTVSFCNPGLILIPAGSGGPFNTGQANPNPSNVFVATLPGIPSTVGVTLKNYFTSSTQSNYISSLLVGPGAANGDTLSFFSQTGASNTILAQGDYIFKDNAAGLVPQSAFGPGSYKPTSYNTVNGSDVYFADSFYTFPVGPYQFAATRGAFTFTNTYGAQDGNGTWSLYFNQNIHADNSGPANGWCMNFTETPPTLNATKGPNGLHVVQGDGVTVGIPGDSVTVDVSNPAGPGSAGGAIPLVVTDIFPAGLIPTGGSGTNWSCGAPSGQTISCSSTEFIAPGNSFDTLTLNFKVSATATAPATVNNKATLTGSAITTGVDSNLLAITVDPAPDVTVTPTHTPPFTQGSTGTITITGHNIISGSKTRSTTTVVDTLPTNWTLSSFNSSGNAWTCGSLNNVVTCTDTEVINGGSDYTALNLVVNIPAAALVSNTNSVTISGGGELASYTGNDTSTDPITVIQVPAFVNINGSSTQSALINTAFGSLAVTVQDAGHVTIPNYSSVVFTASTGGSGQSGTFDNASNTKSVVTGTGGSAGVADPGVFTANGTIGAYTVDVLAGTIHATFNLTNTAPDLTVVKSDGLTANTTNLNAPWTWTLHVANSGTGAAVFPISGTLLTDNLPNANVNYGSASPGNQVGTITNFGSISCGISTSNLSCTASGNPVTMNAGSSFDVTFTATPTAGGAFANPRGGGVCAVNPGHVPAESDFTNNSCSDTVTVTAPDLTIAKVHNGTFKQGDTGDTYTITVTNSGTGASFGTITVADTLPAGLTPTNATGTGWTCPISTQTVTCTSSGVIAASGTSVITLTVNVSATAAASIMNTATVSGGGETVTNNDSSTDTVAVTQVADLTISKVHNGTFTQGDTGDTYTITVTNSGTGSSTGTITVTDTLPAGLTPTNAAGTGWTCPISTQTVTCTSSAVIAPSGTSVITLTVNVAANAASSIMNTATVSGGGEVVTNNDSSTDTVSVAAAPDLTVTKVHNGTFKQGDTGDTYTITVKNSGGANTSGTITMTDTLPAGLTPTNATGTGWTCPISTQTVTCTSNAVLAPNGTSVITLTVNVAANAASSIMNTATVSGGGEVVTNNDSSTDTVTVTQVADLTISKVHNGTFKQGDTGDTYTITVTNSGTGSSSGTITVADTLPVGLTPTNATGTGWTCPISTQTVTCTSSGVIAANGTSVITLTVNVSATAAASIMNTATVSGGGEVVTNNDSSTDTVAVTQVADLTINKIHNGTFTQGDTGDTYTITVTNSGTGSSTGTITVTDTLPAGLTPTNAAGTGWTCPISTQTVTCTSSGVIAPNGTSVITLTVNVSANAASSIMNTATVSGGGEVVTNNDSSTDTVAVTQLADLTVTKVHNGTFKQGDTGDTYTITVKNSGGANTSGTITMTDTLPSGLTPTNATGTGWTCPISTQTVTCTSNAVLAPNGTSVITLTVNVAANAASSIMNTATVSGGGEIVTNNDSSTDTVTIGQVADLTISKVHNGTFSQGDTGDTYTITVTNSGTGSSSGTITVTDTLPAGLTPTLGAGTGWTCPISTQTVTCTSSGVIAPNGTSVITLTVNVSATAAASLMNTATVSGGGEVVTNNDSSTDTVSIGQAADLTISKVHNGTFKQGDTGDTYTITVTNSGTGSSSGTITVTDTLPAGLTPTNAAGTGWTCPISTQTVTCTSSAVIAPNGTSVITLTVNVSATAAASIMNTATVSGGGEVVTNNDSSTDTVSVTQVADLTISKVHNGTFKQGDTGDTYTITVTNSGNASSNGTITVTDTLPASLTPTNAAGTGWTCPISTQTVTCTSSAVLAPNGTSVITLTVNVAANASSSIMNTATVSGGGEVVTNNDSSTDTVTIGQVADLTIGKLHNGTFTQGQTGATYTITVTNSGTGNSAGTITVSDTLPAGLTPTNAAGTGWTCPINTQTVTCTSSAVIAPSGTSAITLTVNVAGNAAASIMNTATVSGGGEVVTNNDSSTDTVSVTQLADLTVGKTHSPSNFVINDQGDSIVVTVTNSGSASTGGQTVTVTDTLPAGLTYSSFTGAGWMCNANMQTVTCTTSNAISGNGGTSQVTILVNVAGNAGSPLTNNVSVGCACTELNAGNNTGMDTIPVLTLINVTLDTTADLNATPKLMVSADGGMSFTAPHTFQWVPGSMHTITTTSPQTSGTTYNWVRWSDGGAISHTVAPSTSTTYTAAFAGPTALGGSISAKTGPSNARVWTVSVGNNGPGWALSTQITGFTLQQTSGAACTPVVTTPLPLLVGDMAPSSTMTANVTINFTGCPSNAFFKLTETESANNGAANGTIVRTNQLQ